MTVNYALLLKEAAAAKYAAERASKAVGNAYDYPERGEAVEVVRGRKVPIGTKGKLFSTGESQYGRWVRFTTEAGEDVIISAANVHFPDIIARHNEVYAAEKQATEAYKAVMAEAVAYVGLDLSKPLEKGTYQQHSYSDTYEAPYAVNPEASDEDVRAVIHALDPAGSSWGQLRWSGGSSLSSRPEPGRAVIFSSTCICD